MLETQVHDDLAKSVVVHLGVTERVRAIATAELAPLVRKIDAEGFYPEAVMRAFGRAGAYAQHLPGHSAKLRSRRGD